MLFICDYNLQLEWEHHLFSFVKQLKHRCSIEQQSLSCAYGFFLTKGNDMQVSISAFAPLCFTTPVLNKSLSVLANSL